MKFVKKFQSAKFFACIAVISTAAMLMFAFKPQEDIYDKINRNLDVFGRVYKEIALNYVDDIDPDKFIEAGIEGMLNTLDPYTVYIDESSRDQIDLITNGKYGGIGITIGVRDSLITITDVMNGYEAQRKGLRVGDRILEIGGKELRGIKIEDLRNLVRGAAGSKVNMKIDREGEIIDFEMTREEIILKNVSYHGYLGEESEGIAYFKLDRFTTNSENEVETVLKTFKAKGNMRGLVVDLRGNGGGLLDAAIGILNKLVDKNSLLLITKGKKGDSEKKYFSKEDPIITADIPIVVLIDHNTASASEIVAGAIQDLDRGIIIGSRSFGKGLVQSFKDLNNNSQLKITSARYFTPSGRWIQEKNYFKENKSGVFIDKNAFSQEEFRTLKGRIVYAHGGITPDVIVDVEPESEVHRALLYKDMFFKYANYYLDRNPGIKSFSADDAVYQDFVSFLQATGFDYVSEADKKIADLRKISETKGYSAGYSDLLAKLEAEVASEERAELEKAKEEIKLNILNEINKRIITESDQIRATFPTDKQLQEAVRVVKDLSFYNGLLGR